MGLSSASSARQASWWQKRMPCRAASTRTTQLPGTWQASRLRKRSRVHAAAMPTMSPAPSFVQLLAADSGAQHGSYSCVSPFACAATHTHAVTQCPSVQVLALALAQRVFDVKVNRKHSHAQAAATPPLPSLLQCKWGCQVWDQTHFCDALLIVLPAVTPKSSTISSQ